MRWVRKIKKPAWKQWFAWHPVWVGNQYVWLENVERYIYCACGEVFIKYRLPTAILDIRALDKDSFDASGY